MSAGCKVKAGGPIARWRSGQWMAA